MWRATPRLPYVQHSQTSPSPHADAQTPLANNKRASATHASLHMAPRHQAPRVPLAPTPSPRIGIALVGSVEDGDGVRARGAHDRVALEHRQRLAQRGERYIHPGVLHAPLAQLVDPQGLRSHREELFA